MLRLSGHGLGSAAALALAIAGACSSGASSGVAAACQLGDTRVCVGPGACTGAQACREDLMGWMDCDCGQSDAGTGDGSGATGGSSGAGAIGGVGGSGGSLSTGGVGGVITVDASGGVGGSSDGGLECIYDALRLDSDRLADVVWAIDTSCSMVEEAAAVQNGINAFAQQITASGVDVRVVMLASAPTISFLPAVCVPAPLGSGSCTPQGADSNPPSFFHHSTAVVNSTDGLNVLYNTYASWKHMLRPDASKSLVIVTDDDATDAPYNNADAFIQAFNALDTALLQDPATLGPAWSMNGVYAFTACATAAAVGTVWRDLIAKTGGVEGDLCAQAFQPTFDAIAQRIIGDATATLCRWSIPPYDSFDPARFNVELVDLGSGTSRIIPYVTSASGCDPTRGGWYYDDLQQPTTVNACPASCNLIEATSDVQLNALFRCATVRG